MRDVTGSRCATVLKGAQHGSIDADLIFASDDTVWIDALSITRNSSADRVTALHRRSAWLRTQVHRELKN